MNEIQVNAMIAELHITINAQLQRLINMAAENAELKETIKEMAAEIDVLKSRQIEIETLKDENGD